MKVHHWLFREFTINLISNWFVEAANFTSGTFDAGVDEADMCGLTPMPSVKVWPTLFQFQAISIQQITVIWHFLSTSRHAAAGQTC